MDSLVTLPCLGLRGAFPLFGCWQEIGDGSKEDLACIVLSFHLGPDNSALEDSRVAYWLAKSTVLPYALACLCGKPMRYTFFT